nr:5-phosphohydroxy-L-lysine phospho-lyase-like [Cherax quadricarinatus]
MPDLYRGPYQSDDPLAVEKYVADAKDVINKARDGGRKLACFIAEPMLTVPGCIDPPAPGFKSSTRWCERLVDFA